MIYSISYQPPLLPTNPGPYFRPGRHENYVVVLSFTIYVVVLSFTAGQCSCKLHRLTPIGKSGEGSWATLEVLDFYVLKLVAYLFREVGNNPRFVIFLAADTFSYLLFISERVDTNAVV